MVSLDLPVPFHQAGCLNYLGRSDKEILHRLDEARIHKLLLLHDEFYLIQLSFTKDQLVFDCLNKDLSPSLTEAISMYIREWFDFETDLSAFYQEVAQDSIFRSLTQHMFGLRLIRVPDLFEAICWAIIGQQINLPFAYQIKKNLVEEYAESFQFDDKKYYLFPTPRAILDASEDRLRELKCSRQKIQYLKIVAAAILEGELSKPELLNLGYEQARKQLISIKGIGNWSANYVLMRCLGFKQSFPIEDAGLHQAIRLHYQLDHKPSMDEVRHYTSDWASWQAYRTFYFWQSLGLN